MPEKENGNFLTVRDIAERLKIDRKTAYKIVHEMRITWIGGSIRVNPDEFDRYVNDNTDGGNEG